MQLTSSAFGNQEKIPAQYTCDGNPPAGGMNPGLKFSDIPLGTKSLTLIMDDPDSPTGTWDHWVLFNIPFATTEILENTKPPGISGKNTFGNSGYGGPCPGSGEHRYVFKLYALDTQLDLKEGATKAQVEEAMRGHILEEAGLIGLYNKR